MLKTLRNTFLNPLREFLHDSRAIGIVLLCCTFISLIIANIPAISHHYIGFWENTFDGTTEHHFHFGFLSLPNSIILIINDFLMAFFFFLAGMEIKRELVKGELSSIKKSILPVAAAIGGMVAPAILFVQFNRTHTEYLHGWAIPTATDIAFTLGIAGILGKRVPVTLKIFITALAIIDDLGAIFVIALFYGGAINLYYLLGALIIAVILYFINKQFNKFSVLHIILGLVMWYCMFNSGLHATIAGVILAFLVPLHQLSAIELKLHTPVYFIIMPIFALANTCIVFPSDMLGMFTNTLSWGIIIGLLIGKPLGINLMSYFFVKRKIASLPAKTNWYQMIGAGILCGIGFTMSIFIATLAFKDLNSQNISKVSVLTGSLLSIVVGYFWFYITPSYRPTQQIPKVNTQPQNVDEDAEHFSA